MAGDRYPGAVRLSKGELHNVPHHRTISSIVLVFCSTALSYSASFVASCCIPLSSFVIVPARRPLHLCFRMRNQCFYSTKTKRDSFLVICQSNTRVFSSNGASQGSVPTRSPLSSSRPMIAAAIAQVCVLAFIRIGSFLPQSEFR
jgi:hypothetical protein